MIPIDSINTLDWRRFKSCNYGGINNDDGYNEFVTEAGLLSNIIRWRDHNFTLVLQNLNREELQSIILELLEAEENNNKIIIYTSKISDVGYMDYKPISGDPSFLFKGVDIRVSRHSNSDRWILTIPLMERVVL